MYIMYTLRTQTASGEIEGESFSLNSAVNFTDLRQGYFQNFSNNKYLVTFS